MTPILPAGTRHCGSLCRLVAYRHTEQDPQVPGLIAVTRRCHPILLRIIRQAWLVPGKTDIACNTRPCWEQLQRRPAVLREDRIRATKQSVQKDFDTVTFKQQLKIRPTHIAWLLPVSGCFQSTGCLYKATQISKMCREGFYNAKFRVVIHVSSVEVFQWKHLLPSVPLPASHTPFQELPSCTAFHRKGCFVKLSFSIEMLWFGWPSLKFPIFFSRKLFVKINFPHQFSISKLFCHILHQSYKLKDLT